MAKSELKLDAVFKDTANAIRAKKGTNEVIAPIDFADEIDSISTGITPTGTIEITENGEDIDVAQYAKANVNVQGSGSDVLLPCWPNRSFSNADFTDSSQNSPGLPLLTIENLNENLNGAYDPTKVKKIIKISMYAPDGSTYAIAGRLYDDEGDFWDTTGGDIGGLNSDFYDNFISQQAIVLPIDTTGWINPEVQWVYNDYIVIGDGDSGMAEYVSEGLTMQDERSNPEAPVPDWWANCPIKDIKGNVLGYITIIAEETAAS